MSASSKKKLRKEQNAASMTEKQKKEYTEAKKLKALSITFIAIMLVVVITTVSVLAVRAVQNSGIIQKNTIALTVGDHEINSVELSYYYNDLISSTYSDWSSSYGEYMSTYLSMMGLDLSAPLDEQYYYGDESLTWADYFLDAAMERAKADYALADKAQADGFELSEEDKSSLESNKSMFSLYASWYGYSNVNKYLAAMYGYGANEDSYYEYSERSALASAYYTAHSDSLTYDDAAIREYETDIYDDYSYFTFACYYLNYTNFLSDGTTDEDGNTTYTDEQHEQARADAKAAAESLLTSTNVEELDAAIAALPVNADTSASSTAYENTKGSALSSVYKEWLTDDARQENDITVIPYETETTDADGNTTTSVSGYYVVLFQSSDDNVRPMGNVRHLLVEFEGGTEDEDGNTTYSDEEKAAAKEEAEGYLATWKEGDATEDSFIELVKENSDDSSAEDGGLFEDINPESNYVENFLNWSIDENRQAGDTEVIETEYGYHVMYYVGASELSFRDYMISEDMRAEDLEEWYNGIVDAATMTEGDTSRIQKDIVLSAS